MTGVHEGYGRVPTNPTDYWAFINKYYPGYKDAAFAGESFAIPNPGTALNAGDPGAVTAGGYAGQLQENSPLNILNGEAFSQLLNFAPNSMGVARDAMQPSMDLLTSLMNEAAPLGEGRGEIVR